MPATALSVSTIIVISAKNGYCRYVYMYTRVQSCNMLHCNISTLWGMGRRGRQGGFTGMHVYLYECSDACRSVLGDCSFSRRCEGLVEGGGGVGCSVINMCM